MKLCEGTFIGIVFVRVKLPRKKVKFGFEVPSFDANFLKGDGKNILSTN